MGDSLRGRTNCPSPAELNEYGIGRLAEARSVEIEAHLRHCSACQHQLEMLTLNPPSDVLIERLKQRAPIDRYAEEVPIEQWINGGGSKHNKKESSENWSGRRAGIYELLEKIGEGGMGTVYKAKHPKLRRIVALKLLPARRLLEKKAIQRFEREMQAVGQLDHENIVRATDAGESDGCHYLVMEFVDGTDLSALCRRLGPLTLGATCEIGRQAAMGLDYAHRSGIVHRDIKPSNLMLTRSGVVKILDFGLSLATGGESLARGSLTASHEIMGTLDYMAPEQADSGQIIDSRADVYSLGATLYKLISGKAPFEDAEFDTLMKKVSAIANCDPPALSQLRPEIPAKLLTVVQTMMHKDAQHRFGSMSEVASALEPFARPSELTRLASAQCDDHDVKTTDTITADQLCGPATNAVSRPMNGTDNVVDDSLHVSPRVAKQRNPRRLSAKPISRAVFAVAGSIIVVLAIVFAVGLGPNGDPPDGHAGSAKRESGGTSPQRRVALAALELGGRVEVATSEDAWYLESAAEIPAETFAISWLELPNVSQVDDDWVRDHIAGLEGLEGIALQHTRVTDATVQRLSEISTLRFVYLYGTRITDSSVARLATLSDLREINIGDTRIGPTATVHLRDSVSLELLHADYTKLNDEALEYVAGLKQLKQLSLAETAITDAGLTHLSGLANLEYLRLDQTRISDDGLDALMGLSRLQQLGLANTLVSGAGRRRLEAALPGCEIRTH